MAPPLPDEFVTLNQECVFDPVSAQTQSDDCTRTVPAHTVWRGAGQPPPVYVAYSQSTLPPTSVISRSLEPSWGTVPRQTFNPHLPIATRPETLSYGHQLSIIEAHDTIFGRSANYQHPVFPDTPPQDTKPKTETKSGRPSNRYPPVTAYDILHSSLPPDTESTKSFPLPNWNDDDTITRHQKRLQIDQSTVSRGSRAAFKAIIPGRYPIHLDAKKVDTKKNSIIENERSCKEDSNTNRQAATKDTSATRYTSQISGEPTDESDANSMDSGSATMDVLSVHSSEFDSNDCAPKTQSGDPAARAHERSPEKEEQVIASEEILDNVVAKMKQELLDELLEVALAECENLPELMDGDASCPKTSSSNDPNIGTSVASSDNTNTNRTSQKRQRSSSNENGDGGSPSEDENGEDRKKRKRGRSSASNERRRLKCPYYQRAPEKYTRAACRGQGFADLAKLKDHLKRVHSQPIRCTRCQEEMASENAYAEHLRKDDFCPKRPEREDDRISAQQFSRLEFKKPPFSLHSSVEVKWRLMYKILFPDDIDIPTPYDDRGISSRIEQLADVLEEELVKELGKILDPAISRLRGRIPSIIKRCKSRVLGITDDDDDHGKAETRLKGQLDNIPAQNTIVSRPGSSNQLYQGQCSVSVNNTEKNQPGEHSPESIQSPKEITRGSSWRNSTASSNGPIPPHMTDGSSAKALGKRPQEPLLSHDLLPEQPWSTMNELDLFNAEAIQNMYNPSNPDQTTTAEEATATHSAKMTGHSWNLQTNSNTNLGDSFINPGGWNYLTPDFEFNQLITDLENDKTEGVERNYVW
ncbi:hypothetical protein DM02DRAFT_193118 [Periconia macrospinosa]|uniref:C2H2-type domain-containing protein n=1 Tax=Periconia macrospinosa TaxID=97972 RepID=A0A2V1E0Y3_9PLEO|nr:hypothetical protein DM02DRAFT_193118 [Periconia macrospinosa]